MRPLVIPLIVGLCCLLFQRDILHVSSSKAGRRQVREGTRYIAGLVAEGRPILATAEARLVVDAYRAMQGQPRIPIETDGSWTIPPGRLQRVFAEFRRRHSIAPGRPVIFVEGGFRPYEFPEPKPSGRGRRFGTIRVWEIVEYGNTTPAASPPSLPPP